jgi:putative phosphonate metabolism protein
LLAGPRFAIYFVPGAGSALYRFGASVLAYDCYTGQAVVRPRAVDLPETEWAALTAEPSTYGFHATLKAPFRLRGEFEAADVLVSLQTLAAAVPAIRLEPAVQLIAGFVAIVPAAASSALDCLAAECVTAFDHFRLPPTEDERSRRLAAGLNPRQAAHLDRWGYPYVFEEFRFHMTLTGRVTPDRREQIHALLQREFARQCGGSPVRIDRIALVRQDRPKCPFRVIGQARLGRNSAG